MCEHPSPPSPAAPEPEGKALEQQSALAEGIGPSLPPVLLHPQNWAGDPPALAVSPPLLFPKVWLHKTFTHAQFFPVASRSVVSVSDAVWGLGQEAPQSMSQGWQGQGHCPSSCAALRGTWGRAGHTKDALLLKTAAPWVPLISQNTFKGSLLCLPGSPLAQLPLIPFLPDPPGSPGPVPLCDNTILGQGPGTPARFRAML